MKNILIIKNEENQKLIVRHIQKGDKWGKDLKNIWGEGEDFTNDNYNSEIDDGIEFYLKSDIPNEIEKGYYLDKQFGMWITRFDIQGFEDVIEFDKCDDGSLNIGAKDNCFISKRNIEEIYNWLGFKMIS